MSRSNGVTREELGQIVDLCDLTANVLRVIVERLGTDDPELSELMDRLETQVIDTRADVRGWHGMDDPDW